MHEQRRRPGEGDIHGSQHGDYTDWDNPEDEEGAPEGYYDDEDEEDSYIPGPEDPDYDLSEAAGYGEWDAPPRESLLPNWLIAVMSILLILAILVPLALQAR